MINIFRMIKAESRCEEAAARALLLEMWSPSLWPGSLLEIQNLRPHPRMTTEPVVSQDPQVIYVPIDVCSAELEGLAFEILMIEWKKWLVDWKAEVDSAELKISESEAPGEVVSLSTASELSLAKPDIRGKQGKIFFLGILYLVYNVPVKWEQNKDAFRMAKIQTSY